MLHKNITICLLAFDVFFFFQTARGGIISGLPNISDSVRDEGAFYLPNEQNAKDAKLIWRLSAPGTYISVGTERGFLGAANSQADRLILLDHDATAKTYNDINIALLKAAASRKDYLLLRFTSSVEDWEKRSADLTAERWAWWVQRVRNKGSSHPFHLPPENATEINPGFGNVNYLFQDEPYEKLMRLAKQDRIEAHQLDLTNPKSVRIVAAALKKVSETVSTLDISNVNDYLDPASLDRVVQEFKSVSTNETMLLLTRQRLGIFDHRRDVNAKPPWDYFAFTFDQFKPADAARRLFEEIKYEGSLLASNPIGLFPEDPRPLGSRFLRIITAHHPSINLVPLTGKESTLRELERLPLGFGSDRCQLLERALKSKQ